MFAAAVAPRATSFLNEAETVVDVFVPPRMSVVAVTTLVASAVAADETLK